MVENGHGNGWNCSWYGIRAGGSALGSLVGYKMGSAVTPIARGTYVGAKGLQGLVKGGVQGAKHGVREAMESEAFKALVDQQADFDTNNWAKDNKAAFMQDLASKGITGSKAEKAWNQN